MANKVSGVKSLENADREITTVLEAMANRALFAVEQKEFLRYHYNGLGDPAKSAVNTMVFEELRVTLRLLRPLREFETVAPLIEQLTNSFKEKLDPIKCGPPVVEFVVGEVLENADDVCENDHPDLSPCPRERATN